MDSIIAKYLSTKKTNSLIYTHISIIQPKGKYLIERDQFENFWKLYNDRMYNDNTTIVGIGENPQEFLPILVDIDLKILLDESDDFKEPPKLYTQEDLDMVIGVYQSIIRHIVEDCTDDNLLCIVLEKPAYTVTIHNKEYLKNGFHLHFPYTFLRNTDQKIHLIPRVQKEIKDLGLFNGNFLSNSPVDAGYVRATWMLYGSRKDKIYNSYFVSRVVNSEGNSISIQEALCDYKIYNRNEIKINFTQPVAYYLPQILSIIPYNRYISSLKMGLGSPIKDSVNSLDKKEFKVYEKMNIRKALSIAKDLLALISSDRADDRNEWLAIGFVLYTIGDGCLESMNLWLDFSKQCEDKYDEASCVYQWSKMRAGNYTLGTLRYYAAMDNEQGYKEFKQNNSKHILHNSGTNNHYDIARALNEEYGDVFRCSSFKFEEWYEFKNHIWKRVERGYTLREKISTVIFDIYAERQQHYAGLMSGASEIDSKHYGLQAESYLKMMQRCKTTPFKNSVMKECMEIFYDPEFKKRLDTDRYKIAFKNGIYDLHKFIFRQGRPDDYLSKTMGIEYVEYNYNDEEIEMVETYLGQVFPDKSVRCYFLDFTCQVFIGGNRDKKAIMFSGNLGNNSKSIIQLIMERMLGEYAIKLPTTIITGKKTSAGSACPELARSGNGVRWAVMQEPDQGEEIQIGRLKELTGNDTFYARTLYQEGQEITPMFKLVIICNDPPQIPFPDNATVNRVRIIPYESVFVENAPENPEEQLRQKIFPMDKNFDLKIPKMAPAFCWYLLEHLKTYSPSPAPAKVMLVTNNYIKRNDIYRQFIEECIFEDEDKYINLKDMYGTFKMWYRESFAGVATPSKNDIRAYFTNLWGNPERGIKWEGYRIRTEKDDGEDKVTATLSG